jgi:hypothetical protein
MADFKLRQWPTWFILQYVHYNPLHVSSITCSSSGGWIVLMQHLVSSSQSVALRCTGRPLTMLKAGSLEEEFLHFQATSRHCNVCIIPQAVTHSLVLLKMGGINARNMLSWLELLINRYCCIYLVFISFNYAGLATEKWECTSEWSSTIDKFCSS